MSEAGSYSEETIRRLVSRLASYATRGSARTQLLMAGKAVVPALIEALDSPIEGVGWCAAKTLGEIGDPGAAEALTAAAARPALREVATEALALIAGAGRTAGGPSGSDDAFARSLAKGRTTCEKTHSGYSFLVTLPGGRRQKVDMMLSLKDSEGSPLVALYTECGAATPQMYEWALKTNLKIPFGAFALRETSQGTRFVMVDAYLRESATEHQLRKTIEMLAKRSDALEEALSSSDEA